MRYFTLIFIALVFCSASSCNKNDDPGPSSSLVGKWRWVKSVGGIAGTTLTPQTEGFTQTQVYGADSTYKMYRNNAIELENTFTVVKNYKQGDQTVDVLKINNNDVNRSAFVIRNDTLYTTDYLFISDGFSTVYVRVK
jgi:hypothetical protein